MALTKEERRHTHCIKIIAEILVNSRVIDRFPESSG